MPDMTNPFTQTGAQAYARTVTGRGNTTPTRAAAMLRQQEIRLKNELEEVTGKLRRLVQAMAKIDDVPEHLQPYLLEPGVTVQSEAIEQGDFAADPDEMDLEAVESELEAIDEQRSFFNDRAKALRDRKKALEGDANTAESGDAA